MRSISPLAGLLLAAAPLLPAFAQSAPASPDATLWGSTSKGAAGELQLYLGQYPNGQFASQAKAALAALAAPGAAAAAAPVPAAQTTQAPPANLVPGWMIEIRAMHKTGQQGSDQSILSSTPQANGAWQPDPVALAIQPAPGPDFDVAHLSAAVQGAGALPALAGSAKLKITQAGQWGIGARVQWQTIGPCELTVRVEGNLVVDTSTGQDTWGGTGDSTFSNAVSLTPGLYDVAWTLVCQPAQQSQMNPDALITLLVAPPGGALEVPPAGTFLHGKKPLN